MAARPSLPTLLVVVGLVLVVVGSVVPAAIQSDPDSEYVHRVDPAGDGTLMQGLEYERSDVLAYENLSERGRAVFDRARTESPYVVENESATAPDFAYTSDHVAVGEGLYPIEYEGEVYGLRTEHATSGFNVAGLLAWVLGRAAFALGLGFVVAGGLWAGWRRLR